MELITTLSSGEIISLVILSVLLLAGLIALRVIFKLTATLVRLGCFLIFLIVAGAAVFLFVS